MQNTLLSHTFLKSQITAILATIVDFVVLFILVEFLQIWYVSAAAIAAFCGAVTGFSLGRHWAFIAKYDKWHQQALRYVIVAVGSMALNTIGIYVITDGLNFHYMTSKVVISIVVAIGFNYPLHKYYVFKKN